MVSIAASGQTSRFRDVRDVSVLRVIPDKPPAARPSSGRVSMGQLGTIGARADSKMGVLVAVAGVDKSDAVISQIGLRLHPADQVPAATLLPQGDRAFL